MVRTRDITVAMDNVPQSLLTQVTSTDGEHKLHIVLAKIQEVMYVKVVLANGMSCEKIANITPPVPEKLDVHLAIKLYKIESNRETHQLLHGMMRDGTLSQKVAFRALIDSAIAHNELIVVSGSAGTTDTRVVLVGGPDGVTFDLADIRYTELTLRRVPGSIMFPDIIAYSIRGAEEEYW